jgi:hypothetical protein
MVELAVEKDLASGTVLYTDSTHLKASANKKQVRSGAGGSEAVAVSGGAG